MTDRGYVFLQGSNSLSLRRPMMLPMNQLMGGGEELWKSFDKGFTGNP
jgi:hypothetical protein